MIGSIRSGSSFYSNSGVSRTVSLISSKWSTTLSLAALGGFAQELSGVSPYSLNPAAAQMMDSLQTDMAVDSQILVNAGYAQAMTQQADSSLAQVNSLLTTVQTDILSMNNSSMTDEQKAAKQMEIQSALSAIDMIGNTTSFAGRKLLDGKPITFNATTDPSNQIEYTPPKVNTGSLGNDTGKLTDLATLLDEGNYQQAMEITQSAQQTIRNGRAEGGNFYNSVQVQSNMISDQMVNIASIYNQTAQTVYGSNAYKQSSFDTAIRNLTTINARYGILQSLLAGINA
jgi:flagellin-like hook-associated protein FlgL